MRRILGAGIIVVIAFAVRFGDLFPPSPPPPEKPLAPVVSQADRPAVAADYLPPAFTQAPLEFLSTASVDSLVLLPGIGPVIAERIASARSDKRLFTRWEDLLQVRGIGPKKLEQLRRLTGDDN